MASGEKIEVTYYLNDVSDDLSQVLMTYNDDGVYDTAYTYGIERVGIDILDGSRPDAQNPLYYLYDGLGSVSYITKPDGDIRDTYQYDEFGKPRGGKLSPDGDKILHNEFGYTGEQWDEESKLQYLRARYYEPETGRFLNRDTYEGEGENPLSKNLYAYVHNNPVRYTDPSGHWVWFVVIGAYYAWSAYDSYKDAKTVLNKRASKSDRWLAGAALGVSIIPGGKIGGKVAKYVGKRAVKYGGKVVKLVKNSKKIKRGVKYTVKSVDLSSWGKGSFKSVYQSAKSHFKKHGKEVGAKDLQQYIRKAEAFKQNLRGASKSKVQGATQGVIRHKKNGK